MELNNDEMMHWSIYYNASDYPGKWVLRRWLIVRGKLEPVPTTDVHVCETLQGARSHVPADRVCVPRQPDDDPVVYESWI